MGEAHSNVFEAIPVWTYEDYATSLTPYEYIHSMRNQPVRQRQMLEIVAGRAKQAGYGYSAFKTTYTKYQAELKAATDNPFANTTDFDGQPITLDCGKYSCTDDGITARNDFGGEIVVCPHPIMPVRRLINIDTGEVKLEVAHKRGKRWHKNIFEKQLLSSAQKIVSLSSYGISVTSESAKALVPYLNEMEDRNYDELPEARSVGRLGWVDGYGFSPYVDGLVFDGNDQYRHAFESVRTAGSEAEWMDLAREVRAGNSIVCRVALAASFASVLIKPLDALPFMVHLWGGAGAGKTVGIMFAASVWAQPSVGEYVKTFNGTQVATELQAAFCGSLPLCLDELQILRDKKGFDEIIYMLCEGAGKARGAKGGGLQRVTTWRNCIITTGEMPITGASSGAGAINRVIELDCKDEKLFRDPRGAVATMTRNYGHAGRKFVQALMADKEIMSALKSIQESFYEQLTGKATDKQVLAASVLLAADAMADMLLFEDGHALKIDDLLPFLTTSDAANANKRAYDWLMDFIASNPNKFHASAGGVYAGDCWGCVDKKFIYIIKMVFDREMQAAGYSPQSFLSWAKRLQLIECSPTEKRLAKKKQVRAGDVSTWCVWVRIPTEDGVVDGDGNTIMLEGGDENEVQQVFPY